MRLTLATTALIIATGTALAQTPATNNAAGSQTPAATLNSTAQTQSPSPSAVQTQNTTARTAAAPVPGRNSFTRGEAAKRITTAGYTNVSGLKKDNRGVWRGTAQKDGNQVGVALDYQGNVVSQ